MAWPCETLSALGSVAAESRECRAEGRPEDHQPTSDGALNGRTRLDDAQPPTSSWKLGPMTSG
jgi:hypothetical protein